MDAKAYQFDLPKIIDYLRVMVRNSNKQQLSQEIGIPYTRLIYFARSANSAPNPKDVTILARHFMQETSFVVPKKVVLITNTPTLVSEPSQIEAVAA